MPTKTMTAGNTLPDGPHRPRHPESGNCFTLCVSTMNPSPPDINTVSSQAFQGKDALWSADDQKRFDLLQAGLHQQFLTVFPNNLAPKTVVVVPSLTLDQDVLESIPGAAFYEERLLCLLLLLRMPRTKIIYLSSLPIDPVIIDYYLHLLPGITGIHARERLTLLSCYDSSLVSLTEKILDRPRLLKRIRASIPAGEAAHIACFNTTPLERTLALALELPIYACDPSLCWMGSKSGSRKLFLEAGLPMPPGAGDLHSKTDIVHAVAALKDMYPGLRKVILKLNEGFSGDGNAVLRFPAELEKRDLFNWIHEHTEDKIEPVAAGLSAGVFLGKFAAMGGIAEAFVEGDIKASPSVQVRINPLGEIDIISTHDQLLGGPGGQVFLGATFPADPAYSREIAAMARQLAAVLKSKGVLGRFSVDFISVKENNRWRHYAIEINLRKGGTTHPYLMLQYLTDGRFDPDSGLFTARSGRPLFYYASDNIQHAAYRGLTPHDLMEITMLHGLHFDGAAQKGVVFHMIGALSQFGKMGIVCIGESPAEAQTLFEKTIAVLDAETRTA